MDINLKQPEIEEALRKYLGSKMNMINSTVTFVFNMGRGNNGLAASLKIEDIPIPGFTGTLIRETANVGACNTVLDTSMTNAKAENKTSGGPVKQRGKTDTKTLREGLLDNVGDPISTLPVVEVLYPADMVVMGNADVTVEVVNANLILDDATTTAADLIDKKVVPVAEAKAAETTDATQAPAAEAQMQPKTTTSLFG